VAALLALACAREARAVDSNGARARALYAEGQAAFLERRFAEARRLFQNAYDLSRAPALLYNMGSALEGEGRPHDAAEQMRAFLLAAPDDPDRAAIEGRIRALEEVQRALDAERLRSAPPRLIAMQGPDPRVLRRRRLIAALSTVGAALVVGGVGVGLWLGLAPKYPETTLHTQRATP
jgi:tetratricopeptide (TPR) repeat protein